MGVPQGCVDGGRICVDGCKLKVRAEMAAGKEKTSDEELAEKVAAPSGARYSEGVERNRQNLMAQMWSCRSR